jgi:hypothetical protein
MPGGEKFILRIPIIRKYPAFGKLQLVIQAYDLCPLWSSLIPNDQKYNIISSSIRAALITAAGEFTAPLYSAYYIIKADGD